MVDLFKRKRKAVFALGILCIAVLAGALLTNGVRSNATNLFAKQPLAVGHEFGTEQLTMSAVRALARGEMTPADIIARYKGRSVTSGIYSFYSEIPGDFALMMGFGRLDPLEVFYIRLIDTRIDVSIELDGVPLALFDRFSTREASLNPPNRIDLTTLFYRLNPYPVNEWTNLESAQSVGTVLDCQNVYRLVRAEGDTVNGYTYFTYTDGKPEFLVGFYAADEAFRFLST